MKFYFAGTPANHREETLIERKIKGRLVSFWWKDDVKWVLKKHGKDKSDAKR